MRRLVFLTLIATFQIPPAAQAQDDIPQGRPVVLRKSREVLQASAIKRVEPEYPPLARAAGISGPVIVELTLDEKGNVISAKTVLGHALLKDAAYDAARRWKFKPTLLSGVPVRVIGELTFNFGLAVSNEQIDAMRKEVEKKPTSAEAHYNLGSAYDDASMHDEAIKEFKTAIRLKPEFAQAHYKLGRSYSAFRLEEAAISFKEAIRLDPRHVEAIAGLGAVSIRLRLYDEAIVNFKRAIELAPRSSGSFFSLGFAYSKTGRKEEAITSIKNGLRIDPDNPQAHYSLGTLYVATENKQAAMDEYKTLRKLDQRLAETLLKEIAK